MEKSVANFDESSETMNTNYHKRYDLGIVNCRPITEHEWLENIPGDQKEEEN